MSATVAQLGARTLRKIGFAIVANSARPASGQTTSAAAIAVNVLRELGIVIDEDQRPGLTSTFAAIEVAIRALRRVGVNPMGPVTAPGAETIYTNTQIATIVLQKLGVISPTETPDGDDIGFTVGIVEDVHEMLNRLGIVNWPSVQIPGRAAEYYATMAMHLAAPAFEKPDNIQAYEQAEMKLRQSALAGMDGQDRAVLIVNSVHDALNAQGLVYWGAGAIPAAYIEDYVALTCQAMLPIVGANADAQSRAETAKEASDAMEHIRRAGIVAGAQARAIAKITSAHEEANALGLVTWTINTIPPAVADAYEDLAVDAMGPQFGRAMDPKRAEMARDRIRRVTMGGPAGQALAEQKVRSVHSFLDATGKTRWTIFDIPDQYEEFYVQMAAYLLAPECMAERDANWWKDGEMAIARLNMVPALREPVRMVAF